MILKYSFWLEFDYKFKNEIYRHEAGSFGVPDLSENQFLSKIPYEGQFFFKYDC